jgi:EpsI family protein
MSAAARSLGVMAVMVAAACGASVLTPQRESVRTAPLDQLIPHTFGSWVEDVTPESQVSLSLRGGNEPLGAEAYDDLLMRTYRRSDGQRVMMTIAYGRNQTQELKLHRPELCYYAQGFEVHALGRRAVHLSATRQLGSTALLTRNRSRIEVVTYWMRVGERITENAWQTRWTILRTGLDGRVPDGILVRASTLAASEANAEQELALQQAFLAELYSAVPQSTRRLLAGA